MRILARYLAALPLGIAMACQSAPREQQEAVTVDTMAGVTPAATPVPPTPAPTPATTPPSTSPPATTPSATAAPTISALVPDSLRLVPNTITEMVVRGSGFSPSGANTVRIGPITLTNVASNAAGTEMRVTVPTRYSTNAEAPPRPLFPGDYPVTVETGGKTSNSKTLKVLP